MNGHMTLDEYQKRAEAFAFYPGRREANGFVYPALGLAGEAGECAEKAKKALRDNDGAMCEERSEALAKELGDVLWYVAVLADELGYSLAHVAEMNLNKLALRKFNGTLGGSGDDR